MKALTEAEKRKRALHEKVKTSDIFIEYRGKFSYQLDDRVAPKYKYFFRREKGGTVYFVAIYTEDDPKMVVRTFKENVI